MDKKYKEISFSGYTSIEEAVAILQEYDERGEAVCGAFNGHMLFSDRITVDGAYLELFGMDKADFEKAKQGYLEGRACEQSEYQKKLQNLKKSGLPEDTIYCHGESGMLGSSMWQASQVSYMRIYRNSVWISWMP